MNPAPALDLSQYWVLTEELSIKHVVDATWGSHYNMWCLCLQLLDLIAHIGPTDAGMACRTHIVSKSQNHFLDLYGQRKSSVM